jgi:type II secretory ATPase GspE/PulE/Tfp pilus assembly ATPase PilB-like protein
MLTTFHAGSAVGALSRLLDMGIEPYLVRSSVRCIVSQRLARALCDCAVWTEEPQARLGLQVSRAKLPRGCERCGNTGYRGRIVLADMLPIVDGPLSSAILAKAETQRLEAIAVEGGMVSKWRRALEAVEAGRTSPAEVRRILGLGGG